MKLSPLTAVVPVGMLLSMSIAARAQTLPDPPALVAKLFFEQTMVQVVLYPDEEYPVAYACYRFRRCSLNDLYRFAGRPNWLTRLAPEPPPSGDELASIEYRWSFAPVTPEENILPQYRATSRVRDEYQAVGRPIDEPD